MRTEKVTVYVYGEYDESILPVLEKEELDKFDTRVLLAARPKGISFMDRKKYVAFQLNHEWAVNVGDYIDIMKSRPHIPNKKEARKIRQEKARKK